MAHPPIPRPLYRNDDWVREVWTKHGYAGEPAPCDCGLFEPIGLVLCRHEDRGHCRAHVGERLTEYYRRKRQDEVRARRTYPGAPFERSKMGTCKWCGELIIHGRVKQRSWHDGRLDEPECFHAYTLHTRLDVQRDYLLARDGKGCGNCGTFDGRWAQMGIVSSAQMRNWGTSWARRFPEETYVGEMCRLEWITAMEVDHKVALILIAHLPDEQRRWFFGPENIWLLCKACHKDKTREDGRKLRVMRAESRSLLTQAS